ncbi:MAG TPA: SPFH domain-containing protein [Thermoplasmata archaeon]|nr:SPFH domain-containing protein [Thermoplasmata archaeon]
MADYTVAIVVGLLLGVLLIFILLARSMYQISPYQQGVVTRLGSYRGILNSGMNFVSPISTVVKVDLRTQVLEVPRQEVITKDNSPTNVDAIIYIKVVDAQKSLFQVQDYHVATVALAQTTLRSVIGDMELDEVLYNRERINTRLRDILDESTDRWGVRVEAVEIKEVDPVGPVKAAMEEQTAAERQRRAAVLRSDGEKRSAILVAEGNKRSRILQAEGVRQSKILEAEGGRVATILEAQGEAQRLRILSLGASTLDAKALTVISLDTIGSLGDGQATKILFPFEFSRLMEGASEYLGTSRTVPDRSLNSLSDLEKAVGSMDDILGPIPKQEELMTEIKSIEDEIKAESDASTAMVNRGAAGGGDSPDLPELDDTMPAAPPSRPSTTPAIGAPPPPTPSPSPGAPPPGSSPPNVDGTPPAKRKPSPP